MKQAKAGELPRIDLTLEDLTRLLERIRSVLASEDYQIIETLVSSFIYTTQLLEKQGITIQELRRLLFGMKSEKLKKILDDVEKEKTAPEDTGSPEEKPGEPTRAGAENPTPPPDEKESPADGGPEKKRKGHGRKPADAYAGAEQIYISHESLKPGDPCPKPGCTGTVYRLLHPSVLVRFQGQAPLGATVIRLEQLRCNLCLTVFTAKAPEWIGPEKFDATASSMIPLLRYGTGVPWNRVEGLQAGFRIPLPASTQWDVTEAAYQKIAPAVEHLKNEAAQGDVFYNDDTTVKILSLMEENKERRREKRGHG
jgi:transposase